VQGVGFRWNTVRTARELGIAGTVRNRPDGAVEVHARGAPDALERLATWLAAGPRAARVESVEAIPAHDELPEDFRIVR
ncbi:MAG TPA: acylphosphatase, partial [Gemmatimonadota bacterium]|nr:acylphosphatase [Gemmatimonadota bacterium]